MVLENGNQISNVRKMVPSGVLEPRYCFVRLSVERRLGCREALVELASRGVLASENTSHNHASEDRIGRCIWGLELTIPFMPGELRDANRDRGAEEQFPTDDAFRVAAEAIESAVRRGDPLDGDQGRHIVVRAAAFHLAGFAARSFSMLPTPALARNLACAGKGSGVSAPQRPSVTARADSGLAQ